MMVAGDPDSVGAQVASLRAAGLDGIIVNMPRVYDLEEVDLAGRTLAAAVGA